MEDSIILDDIKKFMPINYDDDSFNDQLILQINYALSLVIAKGFGPENGFMIDPNTKWPEFTIRTDALPFIKTFCGYKVKLLFDPPLSSAVIESYNKCIAEAEWNISIKE